MNDLLHGSSSSSRKKMFDSVTFWMYLPLFLTFHATYMGVRLGALNLDFVQEMYSSF
jgi:hypothetical protein